MSLIHNHNLHIETGRYCKPEPDSIERIYKYCSDTSIEDEKCFLFLCSFFKDQRRTYFSNLKIVLGNTIPPNERALLQTIFLTENESIIFHLDGKIF